jgi:DNA-binding MarR family transcriptional regulator
VVITGMTRTRTGQAFTELVLETFRLNGRLLAAGDRLAKPLGLTSSRWQILGAIEEQPLSVSHIAKKMGLARQNVQRITDVLAQEGFVHYAANPFHQRAQLACVTPKGMRILSQLSEIQIVWANRISSKTTEADLRITLKTMISLLARLDVDESK